MGSLSAQNTSSQSSKNKSSSASIGGAISPAGVTPTPSIGGSKGNSNGNRSKINGLRHD